MPTPVVAKISADVTGFLSGLSTAGGAMSTFASALTGPVGIAVAAVAGLGYAAFDAGQKWDAAGDQIRIGTGATGEALEDLIEGAKNVSKEVPDSLDKVSTAVADLNTRTGLTGPALEELATQSLTLARITGGDLASQIEATTRVFGDWSIASEDQSETLDYLFKVSQSTGIGIDALAQKTVSYGAPLRQLGFDFETTAALMGKFEKEGVNTEAVFGGLKIGLANLAEIGGDVPTLFREYTEEIKNAASAGEATSLAMEIFGSRAGPDLAAAIREGRFEVDELVATLQGSEETIAKAAAATDGWEESLGILMNRATAILEPIGTFLVDGLIAVTDFIVDSTGPAIDGIISGLETFNAWVKPLTDGLIAVLMPALEIVGGAVAVVGTVLYEIGSVIIPPVLTAVGWLADKLFNVLGWALGKVGEGLSILAEWLNKIPGVAEITGGALDGLKEAAAATGLATDGTAKDVEKLSTAAQKASGDAGIPAVNAALTGDKKGTGVAGGLVKASKSAKAEVFDLAKSMAQAERDAKAFETSVENLRNAATKDLKELHDSSDEVRDSIAGILDESNETFPGLLSDVYSMTTPVVLLGDHYGNVSTKLDDLAENSRLKWESMQGDVMYSADEQKKAYEGFLTDSIAALRDKQPNLSSAQAAELAKMEAALGTFRTDGAGEVGGFVTDSLTELGAFASSAVGKLFASPFDKASMGEKLSGIADEFKTKFVQKGLDYITGPEGLINKGINALLGSLDKVIGKLTGSGGVASALSTAFGGGGGVVDAVSGGASTDAAGTVASAASSVFNPINAIANVGTLVSSVFGNFQNARQETTLNAIEHEVRYSQIHLLNLLDGTNGANKWWPKLGELEGVHAQLRWLNDVTMKDLIAAARGGSDRVAAAVDSGMKALLQQPIVVTLHNTTYLDGAQIAQSVEERIVERNQLQGAFGL